MTGHGFLQCSLTQTFKRLHIREINSYLINCNDVVLQNGFKCFVNATKSSNRLPFGKSRDFYDSYPEFHTIMDKEGEKVLKQLSKLMKHAGLKGNIGRRDDDDKIEMIIEANDSILGKVVSK